MESGHEPATKMDISELRAEMAEIRKESEAADMMLRSRLSVVENRVEDFERRINQPPLQTH
jgi:hypothetical protein